MELWILWYYLRLALNRIRNWRKPPRVRSDCEQLWFDLFTGPVYTVWT